MLEADNYRLINEKDNEIKKHEKLEKILKKIVNAIDKYPVRINVDDLTKSDINEKINYFQFLYYTVKDEIIKKYNIFL